VNDLPGDHDRRPSDRPGGSRGCAFDEPLEAWVPLEAPEETARDDHEQVGGREHSDGRDDGTDDPGDEIAGEGAHDHDRAGTDQAHSDGVRELPLGQPVMVADQALMEKWHHRKAGSERERARLGEKARHRGY